MSRTTRTCAYCVDGRTCPACIAKRIKPVTAPPTRHEEALAMLEDEERQSRNAALHHRSFREPMADAHAANCDASANAYAYAAQCVREVAALRAENATLRERAAIVEAMERGECAVWPSSTTTDGKVASFGIAVAGRLFDIAARATHKETGDA